MKKNLIIAAFLAAFCLTQAAAQDDDKNMFDHLSVGITAGTPGIGADVAMPVGNYVQLRAGFAVMPKIKMNTNLDVYVPDDASYDIPEEIKIQGKLSLATGKILADVFPFKRSSFHVTAGFYFGGSSVVDVYNREDGALSEVTRYNNEHPDDLIGAQLGDYLLTPDEDGNVKAELKTNGFRPYLGLGFGRAVPKKRVGFMFELGCQFWGSPTVYCNGEKLDKNKVGDEDGGIIKTLSKITVYPVLNFRICGRIL